MAYLEISENKQKAIDDFINGIPVVNEKVYIPYSYISSYVSGREINKLTEVIVLEVLPDNKFKVKTNEYGYKSEIVEVDRSEIKRHMRHIGANPFERRFRPVTTINYSFDSLIYKFEMCERRRDENYHICGIKVNEVNWNPYVYDKNGKKQYYQRDFVWTLEDKRLLIESIYQGINCGLILVRTHAWDDLEKLAKKGETELAFIDIVDGKQRLNAVKGFLNNEFTDNYGNYYSDLSNDCQREFTGHQLFQYAELGDRTTDEEVLYQFLKLNFAGVPQSQEHIDFVKNISKKI